MEAKRLSLSSAWISASQQGVATLPQLFDSGRAFHSAAANMGDSSFAFHFFSPFLGRILPGCSSVFYVVILGDGGSLPFSYLRSENGDTDDFGAVASTTPVLSESEFLLLFGEASGDSPMVAFGVFKALFVVNAGYQVTL